MRCCALFCLLFVSPLTGPAQAEETFAFFVVGDPQYHAEKGQPRLDPFSEAANQRGLDVLLALPGKTIGEQAGGGRVAKDILAVLATGDLIDSGDKNGRAYEAMQRVEWQRFVADFGLTGHEGRLPWPVYEIHGNHDGPQGDTFIVADIIARNKQRPGVVQRSENGLHYSFDLGPLHVVALGMFAGAGESRREGHHYAARQSLEFLQKDLQQQVADSGRPVAAMFHLHPNGPEYDWPGEDLQALWKALQPYNVIALFHGHTHASPPSRLMWDGQKFAPELPGGIDVFNPDDLGATKRDPRHPQRPASTRHGFLYVELIDADGTKGDRLVVRSLATRDGWKTYQWDRMWTRPVKIPAVPATQ